MATIPFTGFAVQHYQIVTVEVMLRASVELVAESRHCRHAFEHEYDLTALALERFRFQEYDKAPSREVPTSVLDSVKLGSHCVHSTSRVSVAILLGWKFSKQDRPPSNRGAWFQR